MTLGHFKELDDGGKYLSISPKGFAEVREYLKRLLRIGDDVFNIIGFINIIEYIKHLKDGPTKSRKK